MGKITAVDREERGNLFFILPLRNHTYTIHHSLKTKRKKIDTSCCYCLELYLSHRQTITLTKCNPKFNYWVRWHTIKHALWEFQRKLLLKFLSFRDMALTEITVCGSDKTKSSKTEGFFFINFRNLSFICIFIYCSLGKSKTPVSLCNSIISLFHFVVYKQPLYSTTVESNKIWLKYRPNLVQGF